MPGDNNSESKENINNSQIENKNNEGAKDKGEENKTIPYSRFQEVNNKFKTASEELESYRKKEKEENDKKLLEEKNFQELIGKKDAALKELETKYGQEVLKYKTEKLGSKISNLLAKNNIVDAEDGLKFVKYDDLIDSENAEDEINKRVNELVKNKPYLFKSNSRSSTENYVAGSQKKDNNPGEKATVESLLAQKLLKN